VNLPSILHPLRRVSKVIAVALAIAACVLVASSIKAGAAPQTVNVLASSGDTEMRSADRMVNLGSATTITVDGDEPAGTGKSTAALIRFGLPTVPAGAAITDAKLRLNIINSSTDTYRVFVMTEAWVEDEATWNMYSRASHWDRAGGLGANDREPAAVASISPSATGVRDFDLGAAFDQQVDDWMSGKEANEGIQIINANGTDGFDFSTREAATNPQRPQLIVTYEEGIADTTPPETTITSGAADGELLTVNSATFGFSSSEAGSTFECSLDGGTFSSCSSPKGYTDLLNGSHTFEVRATDAAGNTDPTPASTTFSVEVPLPPPLVQCADGVDNDGDGSKDYPADPGCLDAADNDETDPAPPPTPGQLLWDAGAEKQMDQEWAELSTADNCALRTYPGITDSRISRVASPVSTGTYAYRVFLKDGDNCFNERAELGMNLPDRSDMQDRLFREGEERWVAFSVYPAEGFQLNVPTSSWWVTMQMKNGNLGGGPIIEMDPLNGQWVFKRDTNDPSNPNPSGFTSRFTLGAVNKFAWNKFLWHIKFSSDPSVGYVEVYGDLADGQGMRQLLPLTRGATLKIDSNTGAVPPSGVRIGTYRDKALSGDATTYFDSFTVATSRARAESAL
jgi:hypothetical protein